MKIIKNFLLDAIPFTITYFSGIILIAVFYSLSLKQSVEIWYPFSISLFVYLIYMLLMWYRYDTFHKQLKKMTDYKDVDVRLHSCKEKEIYDSIQKLHTAYQDTIGEITSRNVKEKRFFSSWIHNMKTPITVNDLLIQRVEQKEITADSAVLEIKEENEKLLNHLNMALEMNRLSEFSKDYIPEPFDLHQQIIDIINKNKRQFIYNNLFPKLESDLDEPLVLSDKKWNELMITQLISNAIKYSKDSSNVKAIYFSIHLEGKRVVLRIRDEGIGIPESDMKNIYNPFFTGENGRKEYSSSGIGLYLCKEISDLLGHNIKILSKENEGTTVELSYLTKL